MTPNKINIAELLKDCPSGMELYSAIYGRVYFEEVRDTGNAVLINVKTVCNTDVFFYPDGKFNTYYTDSEMSLFPSKDVRTWEGFVPPCKFKDGDVVFSGSDLISIYKEQIGGRFGRLHSHVSLGNSSVLEIDKDNWTLENIRLATEEEKLKLFTAIQDNGYKWNSETKTLEKLIIPRFKVGDRIKWKGHDASGRIEKIEGNVYHVDYGYDDGIIRVSLNMQDDYELAPDKFDITTLKPFDKVLVRDNDEQLWTADLFGCHRKTPFLFLCVGHYTKQCVPYENNEHLLGTTDDCGEYYKTWE